MKYLSSLEWIALTLLAVGGINWGLVGFFDFNLVSALFGEDTLLAKCIYGFVTASALYLPSSVLMTATDDVRYSPTHKALM